MWLWNVLVEQHVKKGKAAQCVDEFIAFVRTAIRVLTKFLFQHPHYVNILFWEAAEQWKTWQRLSYEPDDVGMLNDLVKEAQQNGIVRSDLDPQLFTIFLMSITAGTLRFSGRFGNYRRDTSSGQQEQFIQQVSEFALRGFLHPDHVHHIK